MILDISGGTVCKLPGSQSDHQGKPGNFTDFIDSLCVKPEFSIYTWKLYHFFQYFFDRAAADHPEKEL